MGSPETSQNMVSLCSHGILTGKLILAGSWGRMMEGQLENTTIIKHLVNLSIPSSNMMLTFSH